MKNLMKIIIKLLPSFATVLALTAGAQGAFVDPTWSARVAGLGGAYTALSDDAAGIFYNPAGGVGMMRKEILLSYSKLLTGLETVNISLGQVAYAHPIGKH